MREALSTVVFMVTMFVVLSLLMSYPLMLLWNGCLVPAVTVVREVGWLQMWGISVLVGLMVKTNFSTKD